MTLSKETDEEKRVLQEYDLVCLSHLRWDFVYQRPQHLMSRFAKERRVFFVEEAIIHDAKTEIIVRSAENNLFVVVPHLNRAEIETSGYDKLLEDQLTSFFSAENIEKYAFWYYTPMALKFTGKFHPQTIVYDCMDELSLFKFAPPELLQCEAELLRRADVVFTGGQSLYDAKRHKHNNIWAFPSSIDAAHFNKARSITESPADQAGIGNPQLGYIGVIDERIDAQLIKEIAENRPDWQIVMIGPIVKVSEDDLPHLPNIHYLGMKKYEELPSYLANLDVALMPFAINDSTKFISPTKTPEYLAAGKPVVSTAIKDVVRPYGDKKLVAIASDANEFIAAIENALDENRAEKLAEVDKFLLQTSWDKTWRRMSDLIDEAITEKRKPKAFASER